MKVTIKLANITVGLTQTILCTLTIIPMTFSIIKSGGGPFSWGLMVLPIVIPLSFSALFGLFGFFYFYQNYEITKRWLRRTHILTGIAGTLSFVIMPIFPALIVSIPLAIWLLETMTKENIGEKLLITNGLILTCIITYLAFF
jgi:hypothetical protein